MEATVPEYELRQIPDSSGFFHHIVLARWDNVLGPQTKYIWSTSDASDAALLSILKFIPRLMLSGEACYDSRLNAVDSRIFKIDDGNRIAYGHVFTGRARHDLVSYCLAAIIPGEEMGRLLDWQPILEFQMRRMVQQTQVLLHKGRNPSSFPLFHSTVDAICDVAVYLHRCSLPRTVKVEETLFSGVNQQMDVEVSHGTCGSGPDGGSRRSSSASAITADLLKLAIYAHLRSFRRSVVLGCCAVTVDRMVRTLSLFCLPAEKRCCCTIGVPGGLEDSTGGGAEVQLWHFVPELSVQGLLLPADKADQGSAVEQISTEILQARLPCAIIRLDAGGSVYLSSSYGVHVVLSRRMERQALQDALGDSSDGLPLRCPRGVRGLSAWMLQLQAVKKESRFSSFFTELLRLPTAVKSPVHQSFVLQYMYSLERQAAAIISYLVQQASHSKVARSPGIVGNLFPMEDSDDIWLILSAAERLQPGCCNLACDAAEPSDADVALMDTLFQHSDATATIYTSL